MFVSFLPIRVQISRKTVQNHPVFCRCVNEVSNNRSKFFVSRGTTLFFTISALPIFPDSARLFLELRIGICFCFHTHSERHWPWKKWLGCTDWNIVLIMLGVLFRRSAILVTKRKVFIFLWVVMWTHYLRSPLYEWIFKN